MDALGPMSSTWHKEGSIDVEEDPNPGIKAFLDVIEAAEKPSYDGCKSLILSVALRITNLKCEYIPKRAIDGFASLIKDICSDDNKIPETFYGTKKSLYGLEMPHERINIKGVCCSGKMLSIWINVEYAMQLGFSRTT